FRPPKWRRTARPACASSHFLLPHQCWCLLVCPAEQSTYLGETVLTPIAAAVSSGSVARVGLLSAHHARPLSGAPTTAAQHRPRPARIWRPSRQAIQYGRHRTPV